MEKGDKKILKFPKDFLWGVSTSAYQIEGGIVNDWSRWENSVDRKEVLERDGFNPRDFIAGKACASYERYEEDFDLARGLNCGAFRLGIEWARIEPEKEKFDYQEIEHYKKVFVAAKERNLKIVLTLWHWTNPVWVAEMGGWQNKQTVECFERFVKLCVNEFGQWVDFWITLNEPTIHVGNGYIVGRFPPNKKCLLGAYKAFNNLTKAHKTAYNIIHKKFPDAQVSITNITNYIEPARKWCLIEKGIAKFYNYLANYRFLNKIRHYLDFIGFDYYFHDRMVWHPPFKKNLNKETTDMGWEIYPAGIYYVIKFLSQFQKPIYVMENGIADAKDKKRAKFIQDHLFYIHQAITEGCPVQGYFYWSLLDNFEWADGWKPKFGLFEVDRVTCERQARPSAEVYREICKNNGIKNPKL